MSDLNLYQRINKVMLEVDGVEKGVTITMNNGTRSYNAVSHDDVTRLLHSPIAKAGIVISTSVVASNMEILEKEKEYQNKTTKTKEYMASVTVELTAINMDKPDERLSVTMPSIAFDSSDKAFGKAISMATKYALLKLFMLDSYDDEEKRPDGDYARRDQPKTQTSPIPKKETMSQTLRREAEIENPTPEIEKKPGPLYRFQSGKFIGMQLKDINVDQLENYLVWFKKQSNLGFRQKEILSMIEHYLENYEMFREQVLDLNEKAEA